MRIQELRDNFYPEMEFVKLHHALPKAMPYHLHYKLDVNVNI